MSSEGALGNAIRADFREGTVVFLIGMRINRWRTIRGWVPVDQLPPQPVRHHPVSRVPGGAVADER